MNRFRFDLLHDVIEDREVMESEELVRSMSTPAYATDAQRQDLFLEVMGALDDVSFTTQRLRMDVGKDFITIRRELGGGYNPDIHPNPFDTPVPMSGMVKGLQKEIDEEFDELTKTLETTDE